MARKKKETDVQPNGEAPEATPTAVTVEAEPAGTQPQQPEQPTRAGEVKNRPAVSWAMNSDRSTRIEVSAWVHRHVSAQGEEYEQVSFTAQRSYRDNNDQWQRD